MKCPGCGKESQGRFCSSCGTPLQGGHCGECGAKLAPGARFSTQCGTTTGGGKARAKARGNENLGWYVAAGVLVILIAAVAAGMLFDGNGNGTRSEEHTS